MGQTQGITLPIAGGIDEKTAAEWLDPSQRLASITNGNFYKVGGSDKRLGMGLLPTASLVAGTNNTGLVAPLSSTRLASWSKQNLVMMQAGDQGSGLGVGSGLYAYSDAEAALVPVGPLPPCAAVRRPIALNSGSQALPILVDFPGPSSGTLRLVAYQGPATALGHPTILAMLYDPDSGDVISETQTIYVGSSASAATPVNAIYLPNAAAGKQVVLFILDMTPNGAGVDQATLYAKTFNPATNGFSSSVALVGDTAASGQGLQNATPFFDVAPWVGDPSGRFVVVSNGGGGGMTYSVFTAALVFVTGATFHTCAAGYAPAQLYVDARWGASERIYFWYEEFNSGTVDANAYIQSISGDGSYTNELASTLVKNKSSGGAFPLIPPAWMTTGQIWIGWLQTQTGTGASGAPAYITWNGKWLTVTDGGPSSQIPVPLGAVPIARPFAIQGNVYLPTILSLFTPANAASSTTHSQQGTVFLLVASTYANAQGMLPVATIAPRQCDLTYLIPYTTQQVFYVPWSSASTGNRYAVPTRTIGSSFAGAPGQVTPSTPTWAVDFFFDAASQMKLYQANEFGQELRIAGGFPTICDGTATFEDGFFYYPEFCWASQTGAGSPLTGTYTYAVCYAYTDAAGKLHRSVPCFSQALTLSGAQNPRIHFPAMTMTWRDVANPAQVFAEIYRTTSSPVSPIFYLVDRQVCSGDSSAGYQLYQDNTTDAQLQTSTILYTTGGVVDQPCPPYAAMQCLWLGRLFIVDETLRTIWFTQQDSPGLLAGWNEAFTFPLSDGGDITAIAAMDSNLVIFKKQSIWIVSGQNGPSATAQGSDLTIPQKLATDVGCVAWQSVALTSDGLMFQSLSGIYLLSRSLDVSYVGKEVQDTLAAYPTVMSATVVAGANQVRFVCKGLVANTPTTLVLVYDTLLDQWTTHSYAQLGNAVTVAASAVDQSENFAIASSAGGLWREKPSTSATRYQDDDTSAAAHYVSQSVTMANVKLRGPLSYMRARLFQIFGERLDDCGLTASISVNNDPTIVQSWTWPSTEINDIAENLVEAWVAAAYCKAMAIRITFSDTVGAATSSGQGCRFAIVYVECDDIGQRYRQVATGRRG